MSIEAMKQALEYVQKFKSLWWKVPTCADRVNKATREAISFAHNPIFQLEDVLRQAIEQAEKQEPVAEAYALADKVRTELDKQSCPSAFMNIAWESVVKFHRDLIYITTPLNPMDSIKSSKTLDAQPQQERKCDNCGEFGACCQQPQREWAWVPAPIKTQWGHDMVVADLAIDKDHTVSIYCERDQIEKVEAMLSAQPQREWVGLTDGQYRDIADQVIATLEDRKGVIDLCFEQELVDEIMLEVTETIKTVTEAKLKEKNHVS